MGGRAMSWSCWRGHVARCWKVESSAESFLSSSRRADAWLSAKVTEICATIWDWSESRFTVARLEWSSRDLSATLSARRVMRLNRRFSKSHNVRKTYETLSIFDTKFKIHIFNIKLALSLKCTFLVFSFYFIDLHQTQALVQIAYQSNDLHK